MKAHFIEQQASRDLARRLLVRHLRVGPTVSLTGLSELEVRGFYRAIHGKGAVAGQYPLSYSLARSRPGQIKVSLFVWFYRVIGKEQVFRKVDPDALIKAYDFFHETTSQVFMAELNLTDAWVLARDMVTRSITIEECRVCRLHYAQIEYALVPPGCPFCVMRLRKRVTRTNATRVMAR